MCRLLLVSACLFAAGVDVRSLSVAAGAAGEDGVDGAGTRSARLAAGGFSGMSSWTFDAPENPLVAELGSGRLACWEPDATDLQATVIERGTTASFGLPSLADGHASVLRIPALGPRQGLRLVHGATPNGFFAGEGAVSRYTLVFDLLIPEGARSRWVSLYQTDMTNTTDGEVYSDGQALGGVGINGNYRGQVEPGVWHRITLVMRAAEREGQSHRFVDGRFVGGQGTTGATAKGRRFAFGPEALLFTDDDGETGALYLAGFAFIPEALSMEQVEALGGPRAAGPHLPGPRTRGVAEKLDRRVLNFAHRGDSCCAPENTLSAVFQAFDKGADHLEIDLRLSADGQAIVIHDETLDRTTNERGSVSALTAAELQALDAGSWFGPAFAGEPVPTLTQVLMASKGRGRLYLDIKDPGLPMARAIARALDEADVGPEAVWLWASEREIDRYYAPVIPGARFLIWGPPTPSEAVLKRLRAKGVEGFAFNSDWLYTVDIQTAIPMARSLGLFNIVYTVLDPEFLVEVIELGADGVENDYPAMIQAMQP